ncbi:MAG: hypothetical protein JRJ23_02385 [Deltaproteobacteria bacterium]|nr:hypothetical protein [Deltaproteobacteria bacterium]
MVKIKSLKASREVFKKDRHEFLRSVRCFSSSGMSADRIILKESFEIVRTSQTGLMIESRIKNSTAINPRIVAIR